MWSYGSSKLQNKNFASFPHLNSFLDENTLDVSDGVIELIKRHFFIHGEEIRQYFHDLEDFQKYCCSVKNPFRTSARDLPSQKNVLQ